MIQLSDTAYISEGALYLQNQEGNKIKWCHVDGDILGALLLLDEAIRFRPEPTTRTKYLLDLIDVYEIAGGKDVVR